MASDLLDSLYFVSLVLFHMAVVSCVVAGLGALLFPQPFACGIVDAIGCTLRYTKWERPDECFSPVS